MEKGKTYAIASTVCGGIGLILIITGTQSLIGLILGISGLVLAHKSKKLGYDETYRIVGFIASLITTIIGGIFLVIAIITVGLFAGLLGGALAGV